MNHMLFGNIGVIDYLLLTIVLFTIGICGLVINRKNIITVLMSIELMLLAANLNFIAFSVALQDYAGQIFAVFILAVAAAEAAIGLAILVVYSRNKGNIDIESVNIMKG